MPVSPFFFTIHPAAKSLFLHRYHRMDSQWCELSLFRCENNQKKLFSRSFYFLICIFFGGVAPFEMSDDEFPFEIDMGDGKQLRERSQSISRMEASNANELVKRLSIYQAATSRKAPVVGSGDPTKGFSESRNQLSVEDDDDDLAPPLRSAMSPLILAPRHLRKQSLFFVAQSSSDDEDAERGSPGQAADLTPGHPRAPLMSVGGSSAPVSPQSPSGALSDESRRDSVREDLNTTERFDDGALKEYGRAANEHVFDIWLDLGERTTLADRMDWVTASNAAAEAKARDTVDGYTMASQRLVSNFNARRVDRQVVGTGLGTSAVNSIVEGRYDPRTVLPTLIEAFWDTLDDATYLDACIIEVEKTDSSDNGEPQSALQALENKFGSHFLGASSAREGSPTDHEKTAEESGNRRRSVRTRSVVALESFFEVYRQTDGVGQAAAQSLNISTPLAQAQLSSPSMAAAGKEDAFACSVPLSPSHHGSEGGVEIQRPTVDTHELSILSTTVLSVNTPHIRLPCGAQDATRLLRKCIVQHQPQIAKSISDTVKKLSEMLSPYSFYDFLASCTQALQILNEGDPDCVVSLPVQSSDEPPLVGAEQVMVYVKTNIFERAQEIGSSVYAAEWVLRYIVSFVNAQVAIDEADALAREEIISECVQLVADLKTLTTSVLSLGSKSRHYEEFAQLREWTESQADALITPLENKFEFILRQCPFPEQRSLLKRHFKRLEHMTVNAVKFLCGFDSQWSSTIPFHAAWKEDFLNRSFLRLHGTVATSWMASSLGFVDPILTMLVKAESQNPREYRKRISMAAKVEYMVAVEGADFYSVALSCKGVASSVVGLQLCMGSRYLLDETSREFDDKWGFEMCEALDKKNETNASSEKPTPGGTTSIKPEASAPTSSISEPPQGNVWQPDGATAA